LDFNQKREIGNTGLMAGHNRSLFPEMDASGVFDLFQVRYNAAHRGAETEIFPLLNKERRAAIVSYTATRWGHLLNPKKMPPGEKPLSAADCYRFVLTHPAVDVALCGPKKMAHVEEALRTLDLGPLSDAELERVKMIGRHVHDTVSSIWA